MADAPLGTGLSQAEAERRLAADGPNELRAAATRGWWRLGLELLREPMLGLLAGCAALYLALGELQDALMLLAAVVVVVGITLVQEHRTEQALAALRRLAGPHALVWRDGRRVRIPAREVVTGDLAFVGEGERVPADGTLLDARLLEVDESLLSGESVPVAKAAGVDAAAEADASRIRLFAGTLVTRGSGTLRVDATGPRSQMGLIGEALGSITEAPTPLQREVAQLVRRMGLFALAVCAVVVLAYGAMRGDWLGALLAGMALAMGMLPEEFPVVLTVFTALGAWRMSRRQVLTRRLASLETLGAATVLCVDKTGTLTENRMRVQALVAAEAGAPAHDRLIDAALAATPDDSTDPMERAIRDLAAQRPSPGGRSLRREYPLAPQLLAMSRVWQRADGPVVISAKGAPEAIAALCHLDDASHAALSSAVAALAADGLRVLGVAQAVARHDAQPVSLDTAAADGQHAYAFEWLGLVALADPLRSSVPAALAECRGAGLRVLMITGDHPATAQAIGRQAGFDADATVLTGAEIDALDDDALAERLRRTAVVARAVPAHKLRIVRALQAGGDVVAMTGDGVNDAPALKAADIGVAMGGRGTDVAREAADIVIADDDFGSIVRAVRMGRRLDDNLRRALGFVIAVHVPVAGLGLLAVLAGWPLLLLPAHIALLELLIDPTCSIVFELEPEDARLMQRPPRPAGAPLLGRRLVMGSLLLGALVWAAVAASALWARHAGWSEPATRGLAFGLLLAGNLALIGATLRPDASWRALLGGGNRAWHAALGAAVLVLAGLLGIPAVSALFHMAPASAPQAAAMTAIALGLWLVLRGCSRRIAAA
jgi:Ca2+-transporting ATPase